MLIRCVLAAVVTMVVAQAQGQEPPHTNELVLHHAALPTPALRYELLPNVADMRDQDAEPLYGEAYALVAKLTDERASALIDKYHENPTREELVELVKHFEPVWEPLRSAALSDRCNWKHTIRTESIEARLPYLAQMRVMAILVAARVRLHVIDRDYEQAIEHLQYGFAMVRHMNDKPALLQGLVAAGMAHLFLDEIERMIQAPDAPNLYWALTNLPTPMLDRYAISQWERTFIRPLIAGDTREEWIVQYRAFEGMRVQSGQPQPLNFDEDVAAALPAAREELLRAGMTEQQLSEMEDWRIAVTWTNRELERVLGEMWKGWLLPPPQARSLFVLAVADYKAAVDSDATLRPVMAMMPSLPHSHSHMHGLDRRIAALRVIEAIRAHGKLPANLEELALPMPLDVITGEPFRYARQGDHAKLDRTLENDRNRNVSVVYRLRCE